jgi:hypothetical protein
MTGPAAMCATDASAARLDGSFELVQDDRGARIIRRPILRRSGQIPHLVAGFELCLISDHAPEGFADRLLDMLNDANAWGQI